MRSKPKKKSVKAHAEIKVPSLDPNAEGIAVAYNKFLPEARALSSAEVQPLKGNVRWFPGNVTCGVLSLAPYMGQLKVELPKLDVDRFDQMESLADVVVYAADSVVRNLATPDELKAWVEECRTTRTKFLAIADIFVTEGVFPEKTVAQIRAGKGQTAAARNLAQLAKLFREHSAELSGKVPVTTEDLTDAELLSQKILTALNKRIATKATTSNPQVAAAIDVRDRLYTILVQRHADLLKAGTYVFGRDVNEHVPLLASHSRAANEKKGTVTAAPPATASPPATSTTTTTPAAASTAATAPAQEVNATR